MREALLEAELPAVLLAFALAFPAAFAAGRPGIAEERSDVPVLTLVELLEGRGMADRSCGARAEADAEPLKRSGLLVMTGLSVVDRAGGVLLLSDCISDLPDIGVSGAILSCGTFMSPTYLDCSL